MKLLKADKTDRLGYLKSILSQIRLNDPEIILLIESEINRKYGVRQQQGLSKEIVRRLKIQNLKLLEQVERLKEQVKQAKEQKEEAQTASDKPQKLVKGLADALGACHICWGNDDDCPHCSGDGIPGSRKINRRLFNIYVLPTLEKLYGLGLK